MPSERTSGGPARLRLQGGFDFERLNRFSQAHHPHPGSPVIGKFQDSHANQFADRLANRDRAYPKFLRQACFHNAFARHEFPAPNSPQECLADDFTTKCWQGACSSWEKDHI